MDIVPLPIEGVFTVRPRRHEDQRGWFEESFNQKRFSETGVTPGFVQDNQSVSHSVGTVRGLHFQAPPFAQAKLVRVLAGAVLDVAVDLRRGSPTYGRWVSAELSADNGVQIFVPRGFAHGFVTRTPDTIVAYKVDAHYDRESDGGIHFADPDLAIDWGVAPADAVLSDKDRALPAFADITPFTL
ncbi:MAG: dTDP-4-dehydrorhamnose 3,5-epimerase [Pseudomonadota bacterium]